MQMEMTNALCPMIPINYHHSVTIIKNFQVRSRLGGHHKLSQSAFVACLGPIKPHQSVSNLGNVHCVCWRLRCDIVKAQNVLDRTPCSKECYHRESYRRSSARRRRSRACRAPRHQRRCSTATSGGGEQRSKKQRAVCRWRESWAILRITQASRALSSFLVARKERESA